MDISREETCPAQPKELILGNSRSTLSLEEAQDFCRAALLGDIAVAEDKEKLEKIVEESSIGDDCPGPFIGYNDRKEEGSFVHIYTGDLMPNFTWGEDQPNNLDGDQDCAVVADKKSKMINDMTCSFLLCPVCQLQSLQVFQMSGHLDDTAADRYYLLLEVTNKSEGELVKYSFIRRENFLDTCRPHCPGLSRT